MNNIVIIGAGGFGREVAWLIEEINENEEKWNLLGFVDDDENYHNKSLNGYPVLGNVDWLKSKEVHAVCAVGNPIVKKKIINRLHGSNIKYPVLIHPNVRHSSSVDFGEGTIVCLDTVLTVNIKIGNHVIINLDCTIGHDAIIKDYSTILPSVNVSGYVLIKDEVSVGTGTQIIQGITIGEKTTIGAGSVVVRDLPSKCVAVGSPAKAIKHLDL